MSQDNQNRDQQGDRQDADDMMRESRDTGSSDSPQDQAGSGRQDSAPELEETDEMDDEDRDDDSRGDGSPNRRNNIG